MEAIGRTIDLRPDAVLAVESRQREGGRKHGRAEEREGERETQADEEGVYCFWSSSLWRLSSAWLRFEGLR